MFGDDLIILCYHAVSEDWASIGAVEPRVLDRQVRHLLRRRYRPLTLAEACASRTRERAFVVTFDDAFHSVVERGLPVLEGLGVRATVFVPTDFASEAAPMTWSTLGKWVGTPHEAELRCMSWDEVRRLAGLGWEIGSHTCSHPRLTALEPGEAALELDRSKRVCEEELQRACSSLAYPYGLHDRDVVDLAGQTGYESAVTLGERLLDPRRREDPLELSREGVYRTTGWPQFLAATSPALGRLRGGRFFRRLGAAWPRPD